MALAEFESRIRLGGDLAGVYEYADGTGYFYLYRVARGPDQSGAVLDFLYIFSGANIFSTEEVVVQWDEPQVRVGLFLRGQLWAVFNSKTGGKFGGKYFDCDAPEVPQSECFDLTEFEQLGH